MNDKIVYKCGDTGWDSEINDIDEHPHYGYLLDLLKSYTEERGDAGLEEDEWLYNLVKDNVGYDDGPSIPEPVVDVFLDTFRSYTLSHIYRLDGKLVKEPAE